jgi:hypothetical protein
LLAMRPALALLAILLAATGCTSGGSEEPPPTTTTRPTYELNPRTARPDEKPIRMASQQDGETQFDIIGITPSQPSLSGSHAEFNAKGRFYRIRVAITNIGRNFTDFDTRKQVLITEDNVTHVVDDPAMTVKRQPDKFSLGASVRTEFDLYYDIPKDAKVKALRVFGGATLSDQDDATGTDIPLPQ